MEQQKAPSEFPADQVVIYGETNQHSMMFAKPRATIEQSNAQVDGFLDECETWDEKAEAVVEKIRMELQSGEASGALTAASLALWMVYNDPKFDDRRGSLSWIGFIAGENDLFITCGQDDEDHAGYREVVMATNERMKATIH